jgi:hypothetical protein
MPLIDGSNADKTRDGTRDSDIPQLFRNPFAPDTLPIRPDEDAP